MHNERILGRNLSDAQLYQLCKTYGKNAREWLRKFALLLPEVQRRYLYKRRGFDSIHEFAAKLAGMSHAMVDEALRVMDRIQDKPALRSVAEELGFQRVRPVVAIATVETQDFWAEKARGMSKHALEAYVQNYRLNFLPGEDSQPEKRTVTLTIELSPETAAELQKLKGAGEWETLFKELLESRRERLEAEKPKPVRTDSRHIPAAIERWSLCTTRGRCAFPGCRRPKYQLHHTQRWALDRVHDPDQLVPLCKVHNELAHQTLIENENDSPKDWRLAKEPAATGATDAKRAVDLRWAQLRGVGLTN
jgi:hypothetical protein